MRFYIILIALLLPAFAQAESVLPPPNQGNLYVIAHRGAHIGIPENTLAAYQKAIDLGCDFVEIDVRTTKDGHYVSIHNKDVDAYTKDATGLVEDFTLAELQALDIGSRVDPKWKNERVPTFEDILKLCQGKIGIYLDLKNAPIPPLLELIHKYDMARNIVWYSSWKELEMLQELCPTCIPMPDPGTVKMLPKLFKRFEGVQVVSPVWRNFSKEIVDLSHNEKAMVFVDEGDSDPNEWALALSWGTDGIQTDDPEALIKFMKEKK